jgi:hypothetical protein
MIILPFFGSFLYYILPSGSIAHRIVLRAVKEILLLFLVETNVT